MLPKFPKVVTLNNHLLAVTKPIEDKIFAAKAIYPVVLPNFGGSFVVGSIFWFFFSIFFFL